MSSPVITISSSATINEAAAPMSEHATKKLPVIDHEPGSVIGIVTTTDIAKDVLFHKFHPNDA